MENFTAVYRDTGNRYISTWIYHFIGINVTLLLPPVCLGWSYTHETVIFIEWWFWDGTAPGWKTASYYYFFH